MAKQVAAPLMVVALLGGGGAAYMSLDQKKDSDAEVTKEAAPSKEKKGKDRKKKTSPKRTTSILRIPVAIATKDMEAVVDAELPQQIMSRKGQVLAKDLTVDYEVERVGKVSVTTRKGRVNVEVPVQMRGTAYVKRLQVSKTLPFEGKLTMKIESRISLKRDWAIKPRTKITHKWTERAKVSIGIVKIDISEEVDAEIQAQRASLVKDLNKRIKGMVNPRELGEEAWKKLRRPIPVQKTPPVWLRVDPVSASTTKPTSKGGKLIIPIGLEAKLEVVVGKKPKKLPKRPLPKLDTGQEGRDNKFSVYFPIKLDYKDAESIASKTLLNKTFPVQAGVKVKIKGLKIRGDGKKMVVRVKYEATLPAGTVTKGKVTMKGMPVLDEERQVLRVKKFDYDLETRNALLQTREWLVHDKFVDEIKQRLVFPLSKPLKEARKLIEKAVKEQELSDHIDFKAKLTKIELAHIEPGEAAMVTTVKIKGRSEARLNIAE